MSTVTDATEVNGVKVHKGLMISGDELIKATDRFSPDTDTFKRLHPATARSTLKAKMGEIVNLEFEQGVVVCVKDRVCEIVLRDSAGVYWLYKSKKLLPPDSPAAIALINKVEKMLQQR